MKINIFWFRRDLRLHDNTALSAALDSGLPVLPVFIFDTDIISELPVDDPRVSFIHGTLESINTELLKSGSSLYILKSTPDEAWKKLLTSFDINEVFINKDYEPYTIERDNRIKKLLNQHNITLRKYKDQVIFEENEILKGDGKPYTVYTPYKNRWLQKCLPESFSVKSLNKNRSNFFQFNVQFLSIVEIGFRKSHFLRGRPLRGRKGCFACIAAIRRGTPIMLSGLSEIESMPSPPGQPPPGCGRTGS